MAKNDKKATEDNIETNENALEATVDSSETEDAEGLVKMHKDGECLHVHPTTVEAHKSAGWKIA